MFNKYSRLKLFKIKNQNKNSSNNLNQKKKQIIHLQETGHNWIYSMWLPICQIPHSEGNIEGSRHMNPILILLFKGDANMVWKNIYSQLDILKMLRYHINFHWNLMTFMLLLGFTHVELKNHFKQNKICLIMRHLIRILMILGKFWKLIPKRINL